MDSAKTSTADAIKTAEATGDVIGNKIVDKITIVLIDLHPKSSKGLHSQNNDANS